MRETLAALFLRQCGYDGSEPVLDPMCGAGTFVIEAAEIAARLNPGRLRRFAFEQLASFDAEAWQQMRAVRSAARAGAALPRQRPRRRRGRDEPRQCGARRRRRMDRVPAGRDQRGRAAGGPARPRHRQPALWHAAWARPARCCRSTRRSGGCCGSRFAGWRVGLVTSEPRLAQATGLPLLPPGPPVPHGGLRVTLFRTGPLVGSG